MKIIRYLLTKGCLLIILFLSGIISCKSSKHDVTENITSKNETIQETDIIDSNNFSIEEGYCFYNPNKNKERKIPLVLLFDPHAKGDVSIKKYISIAQEMDFIIAASLVSKNGMPIEEILVHTKEIIKEIKNTLPVDTNNIIFAGFSGGGRVATEMAKEFENITGVISCGAANPLVKNRNIRNTVICGDEDFNYIECVSISLNEQNNNQFLFLNFDGKHEWPTAEIMQNAILFCLKKINSKTIFTISQEEIQFLSQENRIRNELARSFTTKNIDWWIKEIEELRKIALTGNSYETKSLKRLLAYIGILSYSYTKKALEIKNSKLTEHCLKIYEYIEPENPDMIAFKKEYKLLVKTNQVN